MSRPPEPRHAEPDEAWSDRARGTVGWITRNQTADLLGVSPATLILWERKGRVVAKLAYRHDVRGGLCEQVVYDPAAIIQLPRRALRAVSKDPDELAARVVEYLELGYGDREIVLELRVAFEKVARLRDLWLDAGGAMRVVTREHADQLTELVGPFETVTELVERVRQAFLMPLSDPMTEPADGPARSSSDRTPTAAPSTIVR